MSPEELLRAAERLGLTVHRRAATGVIDGRRVALDVYYGSRNGQTARAQAFLDPPLDLGLAMDKRALGALVETAEVTGHPDLDGEFVVKGDEPARVRALFQGRLADELAALHRSSFELCVHDAGCAIQQFDGFAEPDPAWVRDALHAAVKVVTIMDEARATLSAADRVRDHANAIDAIARTHGLSMARAPVRASGAIEGHRFELGATRTGRRKYHLYARAAFDTTLGVGLALRRQGLFDNVVTLLGGQDIRVGDAPFDRRFLVRAEREERLPVIFDHAARALLLSIDERYGAVAADDHGVTVDPIPLDLQLDTLVILVELLVELVTRVSRNVVHGGADAGPYR